MIDIEQHHTDGEWSSEITRLRTTNAALKERVKEAVEKYHKEIHEGRVRCEGIVALAVKDAEARVKELIIQNEHHAAEMRRAEVRVEELENELGSLREMFVGRKP